jgi:hypothetical protein
MSNSARNLSFKYKHVRNNIEVGELRAFRDEPPSISMKASSDIPLTFSGAIELTPSFDRLNDRIRPYKTVNGVTTQLGEFYVSGDKEAHGSVNKLYIEGSDGCYMIQNSSCETRPFFPKGMLVTVAIEQSLTALGITKLRVIHSPHKFAIDREDWETGTSWLTIINQLLSEINYDKLHFGLDGFGVIRPYRQPTFTNTDHFYRVDSASIIRPEYTVQSNLHNHYNVFRAVCESPDLPVPLVAIAENNNPSSRLSIPSRKAAGWGNGRIQAPDIRFDCVPNQAALQATADTYRDKSMYADTEVEFSTSLADHGVGDIITLDEPKGTFEELEWGMTLDGKDIMTHLVRRTDYV